MIKTDKIIAALSKEKGLCTGSLCLRKGQREIGCFMGALLFHSSFPDKTLQYVDGNLNLEHVGFWSSNRVFDDTSRAVEILEEEYGLSERAIRVGIELNDFLASLLFFGEDYDRYTETFYTISDEDRRDIIISVVESGLFEEMVAADA